MLSIAFDYV